MFFLGKIDNPSLLSHIWSPIPTVKPNPKTFLTLNSNYKNPNGTWDQMAREQNGS